MLEIDGNNGRIFLTNPRQQHGEVSLISAFVKEGQAKLVSLEANELRSIW